MAGASRVMLVFSGQRLCGCLSDAAFHRRRRRRDCQCARRRPRSQLTMLLYDASIFCQRAAGVGRASLHLCAGGMMAFRKMETSRTSLRRYSPGGWLKAQQGRTGWSSIAVPRVSRSRWALGIFLRRGRTAAPSCTAHARRAANQETRVSSPPPGCLSLSALDTGHDRFTQGFKLRLSQKDAGLALE